MRTLVGAADPGPGESRQLLAQTSTTTSGTGTFWWAVLSPHPGWRPARHEETPGQLTPEATEGEADAPSQ